MKIAILSAMEKERALILPMIRDARQEEVEGLEITKGKINEHDVYLAKCGIGKVNAAIATYKMIHAYKIDLLLNTGVAGGASFKTEIGDLLVADYVAYHDVWCGPGTQPGQADGVDVFMQCDPEIIKIAHRLLDGHRLQVGLICSGDRFISEESEVREIQSLFPEVIAVDMESAAIAQVCSLHGVKFNIIRVISDTPGSGKNIDQYQNFWSEAPEKNFKFVESLLKEL